MRYFFTVLLLSTIMVLPVSGQDLETAKYGSDFLSVGAGARALGMGSAHTAFVQDVTAGYWNIAGLSAVEEFEVIYMHSERFNGIVGYDYGAVAFPSPNSGGTLGISFFRQGVDGIKNTLNAWNPDRNLPRRNAEQYITEFSTYDLAFLISYASTISERLAWGANAKVLNSHLGPFADAWGYSIDLGMQYDARIFDIGINLMDITTMMKFWDVNRSKLEPLADQYGDEIPEGQNELILPTVKAGISREFQFNDFNLLTAADIDFRFEGRRSHYLNVGGISMEPHIGSEITYKNTVSFRAGVTDFTRDFGSLFTATPTLGAGLHFKAIHLDYGFSSFAGSSADLGFTHRISLKVVI